MSIRILPSAEAAWIRRVQGASPPQLLEIIAARSLVWFLARQDVPPPVDPGPFMDPREPEWPSDIFVRLAEADRAFAERLAVAVVLFFCGPRPEHLVFRNARGWLAAQNFLRLAAAFREPYISLAVHHWFEFHRPVLGKILTWSHPSTTRSFAAIGRAALRALARTALPERGGIPDRSFWRPLHERGPVAWQPAAWAGRSLVEPDAFIPGLLRLVAEGVPMKRFAPWIQIAVEHPVCLERWGSLQESLIDAREIDISSP